MTGASGDWARTIARLRRTLQMTQSELAQQVGVTAMTVSRWERGLVEPTAGGYIALGNLSTGKEAWYFWSRAGLVPELVRRAGFVSGNSRADGKAGKKKAYGRGATL